MGIVAAYQRALHAWLDDWQTKCLIFILGAYQAHVTTHPRHARVRADALPPDVNAVLSGVRIQVTKTIPGKNVETVALRTSDRNERELHELWGLPTKTLSVSDDEIVAFRSANVDLISSLAGKEIGEIAEILNQADAEAWGVAEVRQAILDRFDVTKAKADLLARDQVLKFNANLSHSRFGANGITKIVWSGSLDERERPMHYELEGETFDMDDPPITNEDGDHNLPGGDYQCRCVSIPVLPWDDEVEDAPDFDPSDTMGNVLTRGEDGE